LTGSPQTASATLRPFIKWAGGKQALVPEVLRRVPPITGRYFEPFLGGGSVFLALRPRRAVLGDANRWLLDTYRAVRWSARRVSEALETLPNTKADYLRIRARDPWSLDLASRAAQFIYLNKTGFRGLFRVNRDGGFNVPYGAYRRRTHDPDHLRQVGAALRGVDIRHGDFEDVLRDVGTRDFVYLDPPYVKLGGHADFNRYTEARFEEEDHRRLARLCGALARRGVRWMVSQSDTPLVRELFDGFSMERVTARREINLNSRRRDVHELIITSV